SHPAAPFLDQLKAVPFIQRASFAPTRKGNERFDGTLTLRTEQSTFKLPVEFKRSYLDRASTHAVLAVGAASRRASHPLIVFARYVPRPTGELLVAADVNFVDLVGNMHLSLDNKYARTVLGRPESQKHDRKRTLTAAQVQLMFLFVAEPDALKWPVRQIAS